MAYISHTPFHPASFDFIRFFAFLSRYPLSVLLFLQQKAWGFCYTLNLPSDFSSITSNYQIYTTDFTYHPTSDSPLSTLTPHPRATKLHLPREKQLELWFNLAWRSIVLCFLWAWSGDIKLGFVRVHKLLHASLNCEGNTLPSVYVFWFCVCSIERDTLFTNLSII